MLIGHLLIFFTVVINRTDSINRFYHRLKSQIQEHQDIKQRKFTQSRHETNIFSVNYRLASDTLSSVNEEQIMSRLSLLLAQCPIAWQYFAASCYWKFPIRRSWHEAREECARFQADLVVIDSDKEFDYIAKNISDLREDFYVGFHYVNGRKFVRCFRFSFIVFG